MRGEGALGANPMFEFRILGPVQAVRDGREFELGGPKRRALLALLLVAAGRVIPAERLAQELWGGCPPPGAAGTLRAHVSRLRTLLRPEAVLLARGGGYALAAEPEQLDAARFERLAGAGREALEHDAAAAAADRFREALGLWRGRALADVDEVEPLAREAARLEELRLLATEGRIEADLALGRHAELVGELEGLVGEYPVRERLWRLLVLALYRAGRQADALAAYRRARDMLAHELGIEPGAELRALEQQVLRQEVPAPRPAARHNLPAMLTSFLGREEDLARLEGLVGGGRLVTLTGAGGAGKTRLAVEFATSAVERFGDGVWLADLAGIAEAGLVPSVVMGALGVRQSGEAPVMEALVYRLRSAELLLVLDNCEHLLGACAGLAAALLGRCPRLRVLATSREPLGVPGEAVYPVPPLAVPPESADAQTLAGAPGVRLFLARSSAATGPAGVAAPVTVVARICRELDGLPLAIELAAARMSVLSAEEIAARLADRFRFLTSRRPVADPRHQTLRAAIGWSYELLSEEERRAFGELSVFADGFTLAALAAVCCGGDHASALDLVDQLAAKSLLIAEPAVAGTRYRLLETIRQYASKRLTEAGQAERARRRHAEAFLRLAEEERELAVLAREQDNFRAALDFTLGCGSPAGPRLAFALGGFWLARGLFSEARGWLERALAAAAAADGWLRADLLQLLGAVLFAAGDLERAQAVLVEGAEAAAAAGLSAVQARIRILQADIQAEQSGIYTEALDVCAAAAALLESEGHLEGLAEVWLLVGKLRFWGDDTTGCQQALERAISYAGQCGHHYAERESCGWLAANLRNLPIPAEVLIGRAEQQLEAAAGDPWAEAVILHSLSVYYAYAGRFADARAAYRRAQSIFTASGAKLEGALLTMESGRVELMAGDPAAAERELREGHEALAAMGERGYRSSLVTYLADAVCALGKLDQALRLTEEAEALTGADDLGSQTWWRAIRARVLARLGQFPAATRLADEAVSLLPVGRAKPSARRGQSPAATRRAEEEEAAPVLATSYPATSYLAAECLVATGEVSLLAGAFDEAEERLRRALQFYEDRRTVPLAAQARALLTRLATQRRTQAEQPTEAKVKVP
jgi:predicted ATPase/DNA-binding SARP family transcriptional activator